jgi:hypothetical protein
MDSAITLPAGLDAVYTTDVVLAFVFLTVPGIALAMGLKRFRKPGDDGPLLGGGRGGRVKAALHQPMIKAASFVTLLALLLAGLGLVPLARAVYDQLSGVNKWAPALIGLAVVVLLLVKGVAVARDLADGNVDRPYLWLAAAPLAAMLAWAVPVVYGQITEQASRTVQMMIGKQPAGQRDHDEGSDSKETHKRPSPGGKDADHNPDHNAGR